MDPDHVMNFSGVFECGFEFIVTSKELGVHRTYTLRGMSTGWSAATIAWAPLYNAELMMILRTRAIAYTVCVYACIQGVGVVDCHIQRLYDCEDVGPNDSWKKQPKQ